nr:Agt32 [Streptomyces argenteolus]
MRVPEASRAAASSAAPSASAPRREARTTCSAPRVARWRARCPARAPLPPVTRTVPRACQGRDGTGSARRSRRPRARPGAGRPGPRGRGAGGDGGEQVPGGGGVGRGAVGGRGEVDEAAPAVGVLQGGDVAESPGEGLVRAGRRVGFAGADRALGQEPQGRREAAVAEGLEEGEGAGGAGGDGAGCGLGVEGGEGEDGARGASVEGGGQRVQPVGVRRAVVGGRERVDGAAGVREGLGEGVGERGRGRGGGGGEEPVAGEVGGGGRGDGLPALRVQAVGGGVGAVLPVAPGGEVREQGLDGGGVGGAEEGAEPLGLPGVDGLPQGVVGGRDVAGRGGGRDPVVGTAEGVAGQVGAAGAGAGVDLFEVDGLAADVEGGEGAQDVADLVGPVPGTLGGDESGLAVGAADAHRGEDGGGAALEVAAQARGFEGGHGVGEADGVADLAHPVAGRGGALAGRGAGVGPGAGGGGEQGDVRDTQDALLGDGPVGVEHGVHVRAVEGVRDGQAPGAAALCGEVLDDRGDGLLVAADHGLGGAVEGGDRDASAALGVRREGLEDLGLAGLDGGHRAAAFAGLHEPAAGGDQPGGVVEVEDAGDVGGGEFPDGVPGDGAGAQAPALPEAVERDLEGEEGGLGELGLVEEAGLGAVLGGEDDLLERAGEVRREGTADRVEGVAVDGEGGSQGAAHTGALAALSGEEDRGAALPGSGQFLALVLDGGLVGPVLGEGGERLGGLLGARGHDGGAVVEVGAGDGGAVGEVAQFGAGGVGDALGEAGGVGREGGAGPAGDGQDHGGGQVVAAGVASDRGPVEVGAVPPEPGRDRVQAAPVGGVAAAGGQDGGVGVAGERPFQGVPGDGMGGDLDQAQRAVSVGGGDRLDGLRDQHGPAHVAGPVRGVEGGGLQSRAGDGGPEGHRGGGGADGAEAAAEFGGEFGQAEAVRGVVDADAGGGGAACGERAFDGGDRLARPGEADLSGGEVARDGEGVVAEADQVPGLLRGEVADGHRALPGGPFGDQRGPDGDDPGAFLQGEGAGGDGGGDLADALSEDGVGGQAPGTEGAGEGDLDGEEDGLDDVGALQPGVALRGEQLLRHRPAEYGCEGTVAVGEGGAVGGLGEQVAAHAEPLGAVAGEEQRDGGPLTGGGGLVQVREGAAAPRRLFQGDVGVGAAEAEAADPRAAGALAGPRLGPVDDAEPGGLEVDARVGGVEVEAGRQLAVVQGERRLDQPGHAGRRFQVAEVGLGRAQAQGFGAAGGEDLAEGGGLDGVAERGAGAVGLDVGDLGGCQPGVLPGFAEDGRLGTGVGGGEAVGGPVVVDGAAADHGVDAVPGGEGVAQAAQDDDAAALGADVPAGVGVEGAAAALGVESAELAHGDRGVRVQHDVDAAGQGEVGLAGAQAAHGEVGGGQRGAARGGDGEGGPVQAQGVGDAGGDDGVVPAGRRVAADGGGVGAGGEVVLLGHRAEEDAGTGAVQRGGGDPGVLQRGPGGLQGDALLGVHGAGLGGRDPEEAGVELADAVEESAPAGGGPAGGVGVGVQPRVGVPPVGGDLADGVDALAEGLPQGLGVLDAAGQAAADADDGDRVAARRAGRPGGAGPPFGGGSRGVRGEGRDGGVVPHGRAGDLPAEQCGDLAGQFGGAQGR